MSMAAHTTEPDAAFSFLLCVRLTVCRVLFMQEHGEKELARLFQEPSTLRELVGRLRLESVARATWPAECGEPDPIARLWAGEIRDEAAMLAQLRKTFDSIVTLCDTFSGDRFARLHHQKFARRTRHLLGEYYTPDWMARYVFDQLLSVSKARGQASRLTTVGKMLDPSCGSGVFLVEGIRRLRLLLKNQQPTALQTIFDSVVGIDINPVAVATARSNYLLAVADLLDLNDLPAVPVFCGDSITGERFDGARFEEEPFREPFDTLLGNPPWIAWDNLPQETRDRTEPLWRKYGLFTLSGNEARHGGGKKDLSMLMLYATADRFLRPGGRLGFVIAQTLFQTRGAGDGFRRFQIGETGPELGVFHVDDMVGFKPFPGAANWTAILFLEKGAKTVFPVPYCKWSKKSSKNGRRASGQEPTVESFLRVPCLARPIDSARPRSPWLVLPEAEAETPIVIGPSDYEAHLGVNTGGANGVYWLTLLGPGADERTVIVENQPGRGKQVVKPFRGEIEKELLYPLVRWSDVQRWSAVPSTHILLVQDTELRVGLEEETLRRDFPRTYAYLKRYHEMLTARAAYRRYQSRAPFYSMYNVGPYSIAPYRVVWRRMDRRINAAVVEPIDDPILGRRPVLVQETCVQIATDTLEEAHYLCALLNSDPIGAIVSAHSVDGGKSFGSPGMLEYLGLRRYDPSDKTHQELAFGLTCPTLGGRKGR